MSQPNNAPTEAALQRRLFELQALHDVTREITPLQDLPAILRVAALTVAGTLGTALTVGLLTDRHDKTLRRAFSMGLDPAHQEALDALLTQMDAPATGTQVRQVAVEDPDPLATGLHRAGVRLWVPLTIQDRTRGGLGLGPRLSGAAYEAADLHLLETVQHLVQQALHNAELYQAQQEANAELARLNQALEIQVQDRTEALAAAKTALSQDEGAGELIGESVPLQRVLAQLRGVAPTDLTALIRGETGTGKSLAARALHRLSPRRDESFIQVNCGAMPEKLIESELFGHEKGAFTGAVSRKIGKVELAKGGTLFLDEIGDLPLEAQVKLLTLLDSQVFERVGGTQSIEAQVRVVAATNRDLEEMVANKEFREDLFYRLQVFPVELPPLRERPDDIPLLARVMVERFAHRIHRPVPQISDAGMAALQAAAWPGNVRELEHTLQRAVLSCQNNTIEPADANLAAISPVAMTSTEDGPLLTLAENEKRHLERALAACNGSLYGAKGAARLLNVHPETLRYRLKKYGLLKPRRA